MSLTDPPLEITLEFSSTESAEASRRKFAWRAKKYLVKHTAGDVVPVRFPWPKLKTELEALAQPTSNPDILNHLGWSLRELLRKANWARDETQIEAALRAGRPVHLTIRSANADEMYYLPWELLQLSTRVRLSAKEGCLIQYECLPSPSREQARAPKGRILFAFSGASRWVPDGDHLKAIRDACERVGLTFDSTEDVLPDVSRKRLAEKLAETHRPVTALHLLCHGAQVSETAYGVELHSVDPGDEPDRLDPMAIGDLLFSSSRASALRLVTLCACMGGDSGTPAHPLGSLARMFHEQGVPAVVASRLPLTLSGSIKLTQTLYEGLLVKRDNLRTVLHDVRKRLQREETSSDWFSLQLYARAGDEAALYPFSAPPARPSQKASRPELVLICHEAYGQAHPPPEEADAPELLSSRPLRYVNIDQTPTISQRRWENLEPEVARLAAKDGDLRRTYAERGTDIAYYGFPYIPLAVLAGYLAKTRVVHVLEHDRDRGRFAWRQDVPGPHPSLAFAATTREIGSAARIRLSVSAEVSLQDCEEVLADADVKLDLHFTLAQPERGILRREEQLREYAQVITQTLDRYVVGKFGFRSVHVFGAIPVSIAFHLGRALTATGLPECFVYNYDGRDTPRYKWRLSLQAAGEERPAVTIFPS